MDDIDTVAEDAHKFLETVVKLEEFDQKAVSKPKSKLCQLFFLKYKCIVIISILSTFLLTCSTQLLDRYLRNNEVVNLTNGSIDENNEIRNMLLFIINQTKSYADNTK